MDRGKLIQGGLNNVVSFEKFFKENYHLACLVALRYLNDEQEAEDIVQETFLYLWEKRAQIKIHQDLKQYVLRAVKNRCINYINRQKQLLQISEKEIDISLNENPNDNYSQEELAMQISKSIEELPPQCKKIFMLAYLENLTYNEIAETLQLSKNTIKTQMGIAYKYLREKLKRYFLSMFFFPSKQLVNQDTTK